MIDYPHAPLLSATSATEGRRSEMTDPGIPRPEIHAEDALLSRRSIRAFLDKPVPKAFLRRILEAARWAPSGSNIQPWKIHVLTGDARRHYTDAILKAESNGELNTMEYHYYPPEWREPFLARRRACGFGLYGAMGITRKDTTARREAYMENFNFFGASVGLLFWIPSDLEHGSWLDYGTFIHSISIAARGWGLSTIAQGALGEFPHVAHEMFDVTNDYKLIGGMSIGWPDDKAPVNLFQPTRLDVDEFTTWLD
ncbi:MAG: nitroreductase [Pseudomonadota bacterium]|nr:nitroreductase [Pseudomonadota bacterium]